MPDLADHGAATALDDLAEIVGHLMTEGVVGNQQEPGLAALGDDGTGCATACEYVSNAQWKPVGEQSSLVSRVVAGPVNNVIFPFSLAICWTASATAEFVNSATAFTPSTSNQRRAIAEPTSGLF